ADADVVENALLVLEWPQAATVPQARGSGCKLVPAVETTVGVNRQLRETAEFHRLASPRVVISTMRNRGLPRILQAAVGQLNSATGAVIPWSEPCGSAPSRPSSSRRRPPLAPVGPSRSWRTRRSAH